MLYAHYSALGKVLLANSEDGEVKRIIQTAGLPRFTDNTITNEEALLFVEHTAKIGLIFEPHLLCNRANGFSCVQQ